MDDGFCPLRTDQSWYPAASPPKRRPMSRRVVGVVAGAAFVAGGGLGWSHLQSSRPDARQVAETAPPK